MTRPFQCHSEIELCLKSIEIMCSECDRDEAIVELQGLRRWVDNLIAALVKTGEAA